MKTIKTFTSILLVLALPILGFAQQEINLLNSTPYIEVTGEGEMEIIPDEIYLQFTLKERYDGKTKIDIENLEKKLKQQLKQNKFSIENLSLADADADFVTIRRKKKDVLASKDYEYKLANTRELSDLLDILDQIDASNAHISKLDHSTLEQFKKEVKIEAVKNAKEKADYLLGALDEQTGKVLFIQERESYIPMARMKMGAVAFNMEEADTPAVDISFQKLKLNYKVFARFAIKE